MSREGSSGSGSKILGGVISFSNRFIISVGSSLGFSKSIVARSCSRVSDSSKRGVSKVSVSWIFSGFVEVPSILLLIRENWFPEINKVFVKDTGSAFHYVIKLFNVIKVLGCIC